MESDVNEFLTPNLWGANAVAEARTERSIRERRMVMMIIDKQRSAEFEGAFGCGSE